MVEAAGTIRVQTGVLNSSLHTHGSLDMGDRGVIVGSIVVARDGVMASQIGSSRSPRAEIRCGTDYLVERKLAALRDHTIALSGRLRQVEERKRRESASAAGLDVLADRIRVTFRGMNEAARDFLPGLDRNDEACVSVRGSVHPGTLIEICRVSCAVQHPPCHSSPSGWTGSQAGSRYCPTRSACPRRHRRGTAIPQPARPRGRPPGHWMSVTYPDRLHLPVVRFGRMQPGSPRA
jgi:hypothetical protein